MRVTGASERRATHSRSANPCDQAECESRVCFDNVDERPEQIDLRTDGKPAMHAHVNSPAAAERQAAVREIAEVAGVALYQTEQAMRKQVNTLGARGRSKRCAPGRARTASCRPASAATERPPQKMVARLSTRAPETSAVAAG